TPMRILTMRRLTSSSAALERRSGVGGVRSECPDWNGRWPSRIILRSLGGLTDRARELPPVSLADHIIARHLQEPKSQLRRSSTDPPRRPGFPDGSVQRRSQHVARNLIPEQFAIALGQMRMLGEHRLQRL